MIREGENVSNTAEAEEVSICIVFLFLEGQETRADLCEQWKRKEPGKNKLLEPLELKFVETWMFWITETKGWSSLTARNTTFPMGDSIIGSSIQFSEKTDPDSLKFQRADQKTKTDFKLTLPFLPPKWQWWKRQLCQEESGEKAGRSRERPEETRWNKAMTVRRSVFPEIPRLTHLLAVIIQEYLLDYATVESRQIMYLSVLTGHPLFAPGLLSPLPGYH